MSQGGTVIRPAMADDHEAIWQILEPVYRAGETYCIPTDITRDEALADWFAAPFTAFVAERDGQILGTSHVGRNRPGPASHVANASFATHPRARGQGVARALVDHAKAWAREQGFRAMQFNFVVSTNADAVHLWQRAGFAVVGRLPGAFLHPRHGYVDALVMFHDLTGEAA
ncbi:MULTISPECIES: GNAT family N-acetyltransferase [unclassified Paracoccus (in: a-proteobacteria)]|uniref:GNAT family N-acetyltransferase n=1 Tax=unclassified Paracoccus (in: a-proteobacteria) TaxID=2688777 RepID=UPI0012B2BC54|nr:MULTISPECIES: GNAT family N-acetyltransferase [unclassified Paracoccus (in: a-proteobacteria)]UXU75722.1 GNAT family N-acetyltransferase [Paracoccus sp. SMMA_5]UXU81628.1 GNAT family N-acetyltransferase [Paracoccus sp. SMMA_5_TC]